MDRDKKKIIRKIKMDESMNIDEKMITEKIVNETYHFFWGEIIKSFDNYGEKHNFHHISYLAGSALSILLTLCDVQTSSNTTERLKYLLDKIERGVLACLDKEKKDESRV